MRATFSFTVRRAEHGGAVATVTYHGPGLFFDFLRHSFTTDALPAILDPERWGPENTATLELESDTPIRMRDAVAPFRAEITTAMELLSAMAPFTFTLQMQPIPATI